MSKVLVVDHDRANRNRVANRLLADGFEVETACNGEEAMGQLFNGCSVIVTDLKMPHMDGIQLLKAARRRVPHVFVIIVSETVSAETALEALRMGATDFLTKPIDPCELTVKIQRVIEAHELNDQIAELHSRIKVQDEQYKMIGRCGAMRRVFERIRLVADTDATLLITGESGTGKELVARAVHAHSARCKKLFLPVNCAAIAESLIESELFGHEAGSFTGANKRRDGVFQAADGGTLLLDEIGELRKGLQSKLLRALENKTIMRVGSQTQETIDVRMVAATNRNLDELVANNQFREDLFYRLNVIEIALPPLREREEDIPLLAHYFLKTIANENGRPHKELTADALNVLQEYSWPGNVRELQNTMENLVIMSLKDPIDVDDLPPRMRRVEQGSAAVFPHNDLSLRDLECKAIRRALELHQGKRKATAERLGISVRTLQRKIKQYALKSRGCLDPSRGHSLA